MVTTDGTVRREGDISVTLADGRRLPANPGRARPGHRPLRFNPGAQERLGLERNRGLVILSVEPDGPAAAAGLLVGDVILTLGGRPTEDVEDMVDALGGTDVVGRTVVLELVRGGERVKAEVVIGERPRRSG